MIRFWVLFPMLVAASLGVPSLQAATIDVTTNQDIVVDGDNLCSIREAIDASIRADTIRSRTNGRSQITSDRTTLEGQLPRLNTRPEETYSRASLIAMLQTVDEEVRAHANPNAALISDIQAFLSTIIPSDQLPLPPAPGAAQVNAAITLQDRALVFVEAEISALTSKDEIDGCRDGSSFDVILLGEDTYELDGELPINRRMTIRGKGVARSIIRPGRASQRLINIGEFAAVELSGVTLSGGNLGCSGLDQGSGGAVYIAGSLKAEDVLFSNNKGCRGGAVYVAGEGSAAFTSLRFQGNEASGHGGAIFAHAGITLTDVVFGMAAVDPTAAPAVALPEAPNRAGGNGGAIYFEPSGDSGSLTVERSAFLFNQAGNGSAVHIAGPSLVTFENVTFGENRASGRAALNVESVGTDDRLTLNNVTMLNNQSGAQPAGLYIGSLVGIRVSNSLLAGNGSSDCLLPFYASMNATERAVYNQRFTRNYFGVGSAGCPGYRYSLDGDNGDFSDPEGFNYELPSDVAAVGYLVQPLSAAGFYVPIYPIDDTEILLVNRGASTQDNNRCSEFDQRNNDRISFVDVDCDIGAVEYQLGRRNDDVFDILVNETTCIDVAVSDIGDTNYVGGSLTVLDSERRGVKADIVYRDPDGDGDTADDQIAVCPNAQELLDADPLRARDVILFTPQANFRGETNVTYSLAWRTQGEQPFVSGDVSGVGRVFTESRGGIASSSLGAFGWPGLVLLLIAGLCRRAGVAMFAIVALLAASAANAVDNKIFVNSGMDPFDDVAGVPLFVPGDGKCTLREALYTARNDQANLSGGDCINGNEGPDIIEFSPDTLESGYVEKYQEDAPGVPGGKVSVTRMIVRLNTAVTAYGGVTLRCPAVPEPEVGTHRNECIIRRNEAIDLVVDGGRAFSLINSEGGISIVGMIMENGDAGVGNGGAINSRGGISVGQSIFRGNRARTGGALFLRGIRSDLSVYQSTFDGNESTGNADDGVSIREGGGAIATTAADEHRIQIEASTFTRNKSATSAAALSLNSIRTVVVANSTFSANESSAGAGAIDVSGVRSGVTLRNITVVNNRSGSGYAAIEGRSLTLANSIVAGNLAAGGDANCGRGTFASSFNLFGESAGVRACPLGNANPVNSKRYPRDAVLARLGPLQDNGGETWTHAPNLALESRPAEGAQDMRWIVDQGYNIGGVAGDLVPPLDNGRLQCANVDQRGISRESGGRCDIGAYEDLRVTAIDDDGSNLGRLDRDVVFDFLANDLFAPDADKQLRVGCDRSEYGASTLNLRNASGALCFTVDVDAGLDISKFTFLRPAATYCQLDPRDASKTRTICRTPYFRADEIAALVPGRAICEKDDDSFARLMCRTPYSAANSRIEVVPEWVFSSNDTSRAVAPYVLKYTNTENVLTDPEVPLYLRYRSYTQDGEFSNEAAILLQVENIPPFARDDLVRAPVGSTVSIDILANDVDYDNYVTGKPDPTTVVLVGSNCKEEDDIDDFDGDGDRTDRFWQCQFGRATIDPVTGVIAWVPTNKFNPFTERFSYTVKDFEGKESTADVEIVMSRAQASGGGLLGEDDLSDILGIDFLGGLGGGVLGLSALIALRRRSYGRPS